MSIVSQNFLNQFPYIKKMQNFFNEKYPIMQGIISKNYEQFGDKWAEELELLLANMLSQDEKFSKAITGYVNFAIDALRLQVKFEKTPEYENKTYEEAANEVYHNREYMFSLYLPGILLSHFLWPHHYRQKEFFRSAFLSEMETRGITFFADVGIGTGFYSRLMLEALPTVEGQGFDISENARDYALMQVADFDVDERYQVELRDVIENPPINITDCLISVEVLEHLESPIDFLKGLRLMLRQGGKAFITAALNAPNADHIYLYRNVMDVIQQINEAGFIVEQFHSGFGHAPRKPGASVPEISAFIVT